MNLYLPVYATEDIFDFDKHSEKLGAVVCFKEQPFSHQTGAQIRFHMEHGTVICRYVNMTKDAYYDKLAAFVAQEIWCIYGEACINGAIVWKPMTRAEAETMHEMGAHLFYTDDSF